MTWDLPIPFMARQFKIWALKISLRNFCQYLWRSLTSWSYIRVIQSIFLLSSQSSIISVDGEVYLRSLKKLFYKKVGNLKFCSKIWIFFKLWTNSNFMRFYSKNFGFITFDIFEIILQFNFLNFPFLINILIWPRYIFQRLDWDR